MREFAFMQLEHEDADGVEGVGQEAQDSFEQEIQMAAEGRWDDLDIDDGPLT